MLLLSQLLYLFKTGKCSSKLEKCDSLSENSLNLLLKQHTQLFFTIVTRLLTNVLAFYISSSFLLFLFLLELQFSIMFASFYCIIPYKNCDAPQNVVRHQLPLKDICHSSKRFQFQFCIYLKSQLEHLCACVFVYEGAHSTYTEKVLN